jgi:ribulose 1,5-bisphosphate carboxylase large subunit-like protein
VKTNKAIKRLTHVEDLLSDVMERYSANASDIQENLQSAKAARFIANSAFPLPPFTYNKPS